LFFALLAGALLTPGDTHKVLSGLDIEYFALFIADDCSLFAATAADALAERAGDDLLDAFQMRRQRLTAGMFALLVRTRTDELRIIIVIS
jgi:hypothetical protein